MNGNELEHLKDHMRDLINGSDKLTKVQFDNVREDISEIKKEVKENKGATGLLSTKVDEYVFNHYSFHQRCKKSMYRCVGIGCVLVMILILSGAAQALLAYLGSILKLLF